MVNEMKVFKIDFKKLAQWMLPFSLRRDGVSALLYAMTAPVRVLYDEFMRNRAANIYRLRITPQVCYLEKFLSDRYDFSERRIRIVDGVHIVPLYIHLEAEKRPLYIYAEAEGSPLSLYCENEILGGTDFIIRLPAGLKYNENQMKGEVDSYKLAGKKYRIETV